MSEPVPAPSFPGLRRLVARLAEVGCRPEDDEEVRARKGTLVVAAAIVTTLAVGWVVIYLALGAPVSAAIPFSYQIVSIVSLVLFARTGNYGRFRASQTVLMLLLPFLLQWSLGGYAASSAVSLWALIAALGALFFYSAAAAIPWFGAFVGLNVLSALLDPAVSARAALIPDELRLAFFVMNISGVSLTAWLLLLYFVRAREAALARSDQLLLNILPAAIAARLKRELGVIAEHHEAVTVLFADLASFTPFVERTPAARVIAVLDEIFSAFDALAERHGLEKIKTIGDAYMAVAGLPEPRSDHAEAAAAMALDMLTETERLAAALGFPDGELAVRIGLDSGPVVAGVIGQRKFSYDTWGDVVNTASRMESSGVAGRIQVTRAVRDRLADAYAFEAREAFEVKGKGRLETYFLVGPADVGATGRT